MKSHFSSAQGEPLSYSLNILKGVNAQTIECLMLTNLTKAEAAQQGCVFSGLRFPAYPAQSGYPYPPASLAKIAIILQLVTRKDYNMYTWRIRNIKAHRETFGDTGCLQFKGLIWSQGLLGERQRNAQPLSWGSIWQKPLLFLHALKSRASISFSGLCILLHLFQGSELAVAINSKNRDQWR